MVTVRIAPHVTAIATPIPIPGLGFLPINAFVITRPSASPILVDTCITLEKGAFVDTLSGVVDPADIEWIWLTHADRDHTGGLQEILTEAPGARVIANFTTVGHLSVGPDPIPMDRVHVVNDGDRVDLGDRELIAVRPPLFDNPGTVGFFDPSTNILVSADCFGGPTSTEEEAIASDVAAIPDDRLRDSQLAWGSADSPWAHTADQAKFDATLDSIRKLDPSLILSTHLPAIHGNTDRHLETLAMLPSSTPFVGPNQAMLEAMLAQMEPTER